MTRAASNPLLQMIRRVLEGERVRQLSDQALLQEFKERGDEAAFKALLYRHGPMILSVCRNVLGNDADAEDAFQATCVILVRKAASIRKTASIGSWLHGVAYRTALKARARAQAREKKESCTPGRPASDPGDLAWREVRQVLHEELTGLAERFRAPLVACYLEGKTQQEAAAQLGMAKSTLKERLERGRSLLRARLVRRGLGPAALLTVAAWPDASASVPGTLMSSTVKAATLIARGQAVMVVLSPNVAALTEGALKTVFLTKLKLATALLLGSALVATGAGLAVFPGQQGEGDRGPGMDVAMERADRTGPTEAQGETRELPAGSRTEPEREQRETPPPGERTPIKEADQDSGVPPHSPHNGHHAREPRGIDGEFGYHPEGHHHHRGPPDGHPLSRFSTGGDS
ncbi:MAG: sigma-70 family RNA polymerase sigma factor [Planctomycetes bacterium]|nr:sigma-70 family RNA polymerase sigma factor [Planctomycetota bacterium]